MTTKSQSASWVERAFLEHHFYKGGLRTEAYSLSGQRPAWAPEPDWAGFRDEFALAPGDQVVEVVKFATPSGPIAWIGVFESAPDQVYGDRKNHAGMGVWLLGGYPKTPSILVDSLKALLEAASKGSGNSLQSHSSTFLSEYLGSYVDEYEALPRPLGGLSFARNQVASTLVRKINNTREDFEEALDDVILRLFYYLDPEESEKSRALILLSANVSEHETAQGRHGKIVQDLLRQLPESLRAQSQSIAMLEQDLATRVGEVDKLDGEVDRLNKELLAARRRANEVETQLSELQASLDEDDERKRFSLLHSGLSDLGSNVAQLQGKLSALRQDIVADIRRDLKALPVAAPSNSQFRAQYASAEPGKQHYHRSTQHDSNLLIWISVGLLIVFIIGAAVWLLLNR